MSDFNITLFEACEFLNRSKKSISRYIRRGLLHPQEIKSKQGTLEYRFSKADLEAFKAKEAEKTDQTEQTRQDRIEETNQTGHLDQTGHKEPIKRAEFLENKDFKGQTQETGQDTGDRTGHGRQDRTGQDSEVITLLRKTTEFLKEQLVKKDEQIKDLGGKIDQLIERDRETNILIGQLQSKILMLEKPKTEETGQETEETGQDKSGQTGRDEPVKKGFIEKVKDFFKKTK